MNTLQIKSSPAKPDRRVAILQSNYIPWKGYFDIIHDVDLFIFYDDVQYTKRDWRNRNKIKTPRGSEWLTVPANGGREDLICEVQLSDSKWQASHWKTIKQFYNKSPFFLYYQKLLEDVYLSNVWTHLSDLNQHLIKIIAHESLGIKTEFVDSRIYAASAVKQERIIELLVKCGATFYLSGPAAKSYIDEAFFSQAGIELAWKDYSGYPEYPQCFPPFEHGVSILDLLFNVGPDAPWYIWGWREAVLNPHQLV
ncbi:MAG: WbqC family protein [Candidatus Competibacteraceae bacterium]